MIGLLVDDKLTFFLLSASRQSGLTFSMFAFIDSLGKERPVLLSFSQSFFLFSVSFFI